MVTICTTSVRGRAFPALVRPRLAGRAQMPPTPQGACSLTSPDLTRRRTADAPAEHPANRRHGAGWTPRGNRQAPGTWRGFNAGRAKAWAERGTGAAGLAVLLMGLVACSSQPSASLPPKAPHTSTPSRAAASSAAPSPASARQAVIAAYLAIWPAGDRAERTGSTDAALSVLGPYTTAAYARTMVAGMQPYWQHHQTARGHMSDHVLKVAVLTGHGGHQAAIVTDCQDATHHYLASARTGKPVPGTRGPAHASLTATMAHANGRWRVAGITFTGKSCTK